MADVVWRPEALDDLRGIIRYIERFDPSAAHSTGARLFAVADSLMVFPNRGRPRDDGTREMANVPPYLLRYRVSEGTVFILGVRHGARGESA